MARPKRPRSLRKRRNQVAGRRLLLEPLEDRQMLATFTVNSTADVGDSGAVPETCDTTLNPDTDPAVPASGICTLRAAVQSANATGGTNTINFSIPVGSVISTRGQLQLTSNTTINAPAGKIVLEGVGDAVSNAAIDTLSVSGGGNTIRNLVINGFGHGIRLHTANNTVRGTIIGLNLDGTPGKGNAVGIGIGGSNNTIGGKNAADRNVVSNNESGIVIAGTQFFPGSGNIIEGNFIGTDTVGQVARPNDVVGVRVFFATDTRLGGAGPAANVIVANESAVIVEGSTSTRNLVIGNMIGTNAAGTQVLGNGKTGVLINDAPGNLIGGTPAGESGNAGNLISGHSEFGIQIVNANASGNTIHSNFIGTDVTGAISDPDGVPNNGDEFGNGFDGILIGAGVTDTTVGGPSATLRNLISGNGGDGIFIGGLGLPATGNEVVGNYIGTKIDGQSALPNGNRGVHLGANAQNNTIGGTAANQRNVVSGNGKEGIGINGLDGSPASGNQVIGNYIGTTADGQSALPNGTRGIQLGTQAQNNTIGGASESRRNVISGNAKEGIGVGDLAGGKATGNEIIGNYIGTKPDGQSALANGTTGVLLGPGAENNTVGGNTPDKRNVISGNSKDGIGISGLEANPATGNEVIGNYIGLNAAGDAALANEVAGVQISSFSTDNKIGGEIGNRRNIISGNAADGVRIGTPDAKNNLVTQNYIGTDAAGTEAIPNQGNGIYIINAQDNRIGELGTTAATGNLISGNGQAGIKIEGDKSTGNVVMANIIGPDMTEKKRLGNRSAGVHILNAPQNVIGGNFPFNPLLNTHVGNVISGNDSVGIKVEGVDANQNYIGANLIGTDDTGKNPLGNLDHGIHILNAVGTRIGAALVNEMSISGNTISSNVQGIRIEGPDAADTIIGDNMIGTTYQGQLSDPPSSLGNDLAGVHIRDSFDTYIGGTVFRDGKATDLPANNISANLVGVEVVGDDARFNVVRTNTIFANRRLPIDLGGDGITENDDEVAPPANPGPNEFLNFPVTDKIVDGQLKAQYEGKRNTEITFDLYKSEAINPRGGGEGQVYVESFTRTTDQDGKIAISHPVQYDPSMQYLSLTATDRGGNTSEFSRPLRQPNFRIDPFAIFARDIIRDDDRFLLPFEITVRNDGTLDADNVIFHVFGNGQVIASAGGVVDLAENAEHTFQGPDQVWDITDIVKQQGTAKNVSLELKIVADPLKAIDELDEGSNIGRATNRVNFRPQIVDIRTEFAEGVFLKNVAVDNVIEVAVDWNGDLEAHAAIGPSDNPQIVFDVEGLQLSPLGEVRLDETEYTKFMLNMGSTLADGQNNITAYAETEALGLLSPFEHLSYEQIEPVPWISGVWTVEESPGSYDKIAIYSATVFVPQVAVAGAFNVPVDRVGVGGGGFGPKLPEAAVQAKVKSDRSGSLRGELKIKGDLADKEIGGINSEIKGQVLGEFEFGDGLDLKRLDVTVGGKVEVVTPRVPLPVPGLRAQGFFGLTVDATLRWEEKNDQLVFKRDVVLGLEPHGKVAAVLGGGPATLSVAGGVSMRGEFSLALEPCLLVGGNVTPFFEITAEVLIFEAKKTFRFPVELPNCGGEGEVHAGNDGLVDSSMGLIPRYVAANHQMEGEPALSGLPQVLYPYAKPSLVQHDDGTMTLVYVNEDASKPTGQHLEIYATRYDGQSWSTPAQLSDDTLVDDAPTVTSDVNGNAIAVWSRLKNTLTDPANTDPADVIDELEVVYSVWDSATDTWSSAIALTDNNSFDFLPRLQTDSSGNVMAVWLHDADSDLPIFYDDDTSSLGSDYHFSTWDGSSWSIPAAAVSGVNTNEVPRFVINGDSGVLVWSHNVDGNYTTDTDREIRAATWDGSDWSSPQILAGAGDGVADIMPEVATRSDAEVITWVKAGVRQDSDVIDQIHVVEYQAGSFTAPRLVLEDESITELKLLHDDDDNGVFIWQGRSTTGPDVFYSVQENTTGQVSEPSQFTDTPSLEWSLNPFFNSDGELEILFTERDIDTEPVPDEGGGGEGEDDDPFLVEVFRGSRLASVAQALATDLTLEDLHFSQPPLPGTTVQVSATIRNAGDLSAAAGEASLSDNGTVAAVLAVPQLLSGQAVELNFDWIVPPSPTQSHTLTVVADSSELLDESDESNNAASIEALQADLRVIDLRSEPLGDTVVVTASVLNQGHTAADPFTVALRTDRPDDGQLVAQQAVAETIPAGGSAEVVLVIDNAAETLQGVRLGWITADAAETVAEADETNNQDFISLNPFSSWRNPFNRYDVDFDGHVSPIDALLVINDLNDGLGRFLARPAAPPMFWDTNGDGFFSPADALGVINFLNNPPEAEQAPLANAVSNDDSYANAGDRATPFGQQVTEATNSPAVAVPRPTLSAGRPDWLWSQYDPRWRGAMPYRLVAQTPTPVAIELPAELEDAIEQLARQTGAR